MSSAELSQIVAELEAALKQAQAIEVTAPIEQMEKAVQRAEKASSGSWLGYQANVYYRGLQTPPPGAHFSSEWGLKETIGDWGTHGDWIEHDPDQLKEIIQELAGKPDLAHVQDTKGKLRALFQTKRSQILSFLTATPQQDGILEAAKQHVSALSLPTIGTVLNKWRPGRSMTRDALAASQGLRVPPHLQLLADATEYRELVSVAQRLATHAHETGSHIERVERLTSSTAKIAKGSTKNSSTKSARGTRTSWPESTGNKLTSAPSQKNSTGKKRTTPRRTKGARTIFLGHGASPVWKELRDFIRDRLKLDWIEFNRGSAAGKPTAVRLTEMLNAADFAFLVMTAEDDQPDGRVVARQNVVHEAGLFQGKLGFNRAIILLENGCDEFSNIHGLGQIRFPKGNIVSKFEEIREVLEREELL